MITLILHTEHDQHDLIFELNYKFVNTKCSMFYLLEYKIERQKNTFVHTVQTENWLTKLGYFNLKNALIV